MSDVNLTMSSISWKSSSYQDMHGFLEQLVSNSSETLIHLPSQGSGSVLAARSSMENLISWPLSSRDSGSAFISQYRCIWEALVGYLLNSACQHSGQNWKKPANVKEWSRDSASVTKQICVDMNMKLLKLTWATFVSFPSTASVVALSPLLGLGGFFLFFVRLVVLSWDTNDSYLFSIFRRLDRRVVAVGAPSEVSAFLFAIIWRVT